MSIITWCNVSKILSLSIIQRKWLKEQNLVKKIVNNIWLLRLMIGKMN